MVLQEEVKNMPKDPANIGKPEVAIKDSWCKGCGICVALCPKKVLAMNAQGKAVVVCPEKCVGCRICAEHCPDYAITVEVE